MKINQFQNGSRSINIAGGIAKVEMHKNNQSNCAHKYSPILLPTSFMTGRQSFNAAYVSPQSNEMKKKTNKRKKEELNKMASHLKLNRAQLNHDRMR